MSKINTIKKKNLFPNSAMVEITRRCNFHCVHCYLGNLRESNKEMSYRDICSVFDQLADMGNLYLCITGGEPLVSKDFWRILKYAKKKSFLIDIKTNGYFITEEVAKCFADIYLGVVEITIYGMNAKSYQAVTGVREGFKRVMLAIDVLRKFKVPFKIGMKVLRQNFSDVKAFRKFTRELGISCVMAIHIMNKLDKTGFKQPCQIDDSMVESFFLSNPDQLELARVMTDYPRCRKIDGSISISSRGEVSPCLLIPHHVTIYDRPISTIYSYNSLFKRIRNLKRSDFTYQCQHCKLVYQCESCPAIFFLNSGNPTSPNPAVDCHYAQLKQVCYDKIEARKKQGVKDESCSF